MRPLQVHVLPAGWTHRVVEVPCPPPPAIGSSASVPLTGIKRRYQLRRFVYRRADGTDCWWLISAPGPEGVVYCTEETPRAVLVETAAQYGYFGINYVKGL